MDSDGFAKCSLPGCFFRNSCPNTKIENSKLASSCSARLQAGICSLPRCPASGGRYWNQNGVLSARLKKETLEASLGNGVKFPVTPPPLPHLPGMEPDAKPESFHFTFTQFTDVRGPATCHFRANMPNMHR